MLQDLRYGWRMLLKHKGFTLVAVLSLGLGIGANTALFSLVDTVLLKTLPVREPQRLALFSWQSGQAFRAGGMRGTFIPAPPGTRAASIFRADMAAELRKSHIQATESPLSDLFAFAPIYGLTAVAGDQAEVVTGQVVSGGYYAGLGVEPILGRAINDADDDVAAAPVVVISHQFWEERFASDPEVIGRQIKLNQTPFTIIGVTPPAFTGALQVDQRPAVTAPISFEPTLLGERSAAPKTGWPHGLWWLHVMGRLRDGATLEQARDSLGPVFQKLALESMPPPRRDGEPVEIDPKDYPQLKAETGSRGLMEMRTIYSTTIYGLFGVVALVLLIACANVANLLLARSALRGPEISLRLAVGAGRARLVRQLLTESVLLSVMGGAVGVLFAYWGRSALSALADRSTRFLPEGVVPGINWRVLAFTLGVSLLTGMLFGLAPALRATRLDLTEALKQGRRSTGAVSRLSKSLVVAQVALSLLLLLGAGLFIRTLINLQHVNLGFNEKNLLMFNLQPGHGGYEGERLSDFYERLFARLDSLPGVRSASFGRIPLISHYSWNTGVRMPGETERNAPERQANRQMVRENYFQAMEIPLLLGRSFTERDTASAPRVAIVNQTFVRRYFPDEPDVLGKRIVDSQGSREAEIVGVVADTKYNNQRNEIEPLLYTSWRQDLTDVGEMYFTLRTSGEPTALAAAVRQTVRELDANLPVEEMTTQEARARRTLGQERIFAQLLGFFGVLALSLAAIGLSGTLAYSVAQRTSEIGVRMALGAQASDVLRLVVWQGMKLVLIGLAAGAAGGYALKRLVESGYLLDASWQRQFAGQLYGVKGADPLTFVVVAGLLAATALVACYLPARRAARVDPLQALRCE